MAAHRSLLCLTLLCLQLAIAYDYMKQTGTDIINNHFYRVYDRSYFRLPEEERKKVDDEAKSLLEQLDKDVTAYNNLPAQMRVDMYGQMFPDISIPLSMYSFEQWQQAWATFRDLYQKAVA